MPLRNIFILLRSIIFEFLLRHEIFFISFCCVRFFFVAVFIVISQSIFSFKIFFQSYFCCCIREHHFNFFTTFDLICIFHFFLLILEKRDKEWMRCYVQSSMITYKLTQIFWSGRVESHFKNMLKPLKHCFNYSNQYS